MFVSLQTEWGAFGIVGIRSASCAFNSDDGRTELYDYVKLIMEI